MYSKESCKPSSSSMHELCTYNVQSLAKYMVSDYDLASNMNRSLWPTFHLMCRRQCKHLLEYHVQLHS